MTGEKPLLGLVMIVKNEARSLRATLASCLPHIDAWTVVDTGSTDASLDILQDIQQKHAPLPGIVDFLPFVDFSTTRNAALKLASERAPTTFTLMLGGDETLIHGETLRDFCRDHRYDTDGAYNVSMDQGNCRYDALRVARTGAGWSWRGVTHEYFGKDGEPPAEKRIPGCSIFHDTEHRDGARNLARDLDLLTAENRKNPDDSRTVFYLAQTHEGLGNLKQAFALYHLRGALGGWTEEVYEALFRKGRVAERAERPWMECEAHYLKAYAHSPHRAEPLYQIAKHYAWEGEWLLCYLFARPAVEIPYPIHARLFVDVPVYQKHLPALMKEACRHAKRLAPLSFPGTL